MAEKNKGVVFIYEANWEVAEFGDQEPQRFDEEEVAEVRALVKKKSHPLLYRILAGKAEVRKEEFSALQKECDDVLAKLKKGSSAFISAVRPNERREGNLYVLAC